MNRNNLLLATFAALTLVFASLTVIEHEQINTLIAVQSSHSETASVGLSFPHNESQIIQFCRFGSVVGSPDQQETQDASGQTITTIFRPVLVMQAPSTAYACVTYQSLLTGPEVGSQPHTFSFELMECHKIGQTGLGCVLSQAMSGSAFPSQITLTPSMPNFTVVYNVTSTVDSIGFYDNAGDTTWGFPLAVGYEASQLNASDFHIDLSAHPTAFEPLRATSVSVIGMGWTFVEFQCTSTMLECISGN